MIWTNRCRCSLTKRLGQGLQHEKGKVKKHEHTRENPLSFATLKTKFIF